MIGDVVKIIIVDVVVDVVVMKVVTEGRLLVEDELGSLVMLVGDVIELVTLLSGELTVVGGFSVVEAVAVT